MDIAFPIVMSYDSCVLYLRRDDTGPLSVVIPPTESE